MIIIEIEHRVLLSKIKQNNLKVAGLHLGVSSMDLNCHHDVLNNIPSSPFLFVLLYLNSLEQPNTVLIPLKIVHLLTFNVMCY